MKKNEAISNIKKIIGNGFTVRATALDSRRVFVKCIAKSGQRAEYDFSVTAAVAALRAAGYPSADRGHNANTVSLFA